MNQHGPKLDSALCGPNTLKFLKMASTTPEDIDSSTADADAVRLAHLGYKQELHRNFSQWSLISFGVTLTGTWCALGGALYGGIYAGGPPGVIYGFILVMLGQLFVGLTIAEFASSYPTTGGKLPFTGRR
jgi:choline transport protein